MKRFTAPSGTFIKNDKGYDSFIPKNLPPEFDIVKLVPLISEASNLVGMLNGYGKNVPNPYLLINPQLMNEAVQSSKIEGSQVSLSDLYHYKINTIKKKFRIIDPEEVNNYVDALEMALRKVSNKEDIDLNLINECHMILLHSVRRKETAQGSLRTKQNWIGLMGSSIKNAKYVPPPPEIVLKLMENLIDFMNNPPRQFIPLIQCAIVHYQFEAIHPYEDGNGRIGRLLIPLMLANKKLLSIPLLYISEYIEQHKKEYYKLLFNVSSKGNWVDWIRYFLLAIIHQAKMSIELIEELVKLRKYYLEKTNIKHISVTVIKIIDILFEMPIITRARIVRKLGVTDKVAKSGLEKLVELGILHDLGIIRTARVYMAKEIYLLVESKHSPDTFTDDL